VVGLEGCGRRIGLSQYEVFITPEALAEIRKLPGHIRQRVKRAIDALADEPRPPQSKELEVPPDIGVAVCRLRLDKWRVVYLVTEAEQLIDVVAVRQRPPYDYGDLQELLTTLG
jgi:mRNA interferase RelE/StbE